MLEALVQKIPPRLCPSCGEAIGTGEKCQDCVWPWEDDTLFAQADKICPKGVCLVFYYDRAGHA